MKTTSYPVLAMMSRPVVAISSSANVFDVLRLAEREHVHHFPIVDNGTLVGVVCTCDLEDVRKDALASKFSKTDVVTIKPWESVEKAAKLMRHRAVGSVVVMGVEGVCGILTRDDVSRHPELARLLEEGRCAACASRQHLRPGPDGAFLCADCSSRAHDDNWFEVGECD